MAVEKMPLLTFVTLFGGQHLYRTASLDRAMDLVKIISELRKERQAVEDALVYLENLARAQGKRRGRPPAYLAKQSGVPKTKRKPFSEETRKKMAAAQRKRWAASRKTKKASS